MEPFDITTIPQDLETPGVVEGAPAAGRRVRQVDAAYAGTDVHHTLYLPADWVEGRRYPVIIEYAGNGPLTMKDGTICTGAVEDASLGYGISAGQSFIWACLPYVSADHTHNQLWWWGDVEATVAYCKRVVHQICHDYGGDAGAVLLAGFSRGAIACNYIGLHDDEIAGLWSAFVVHSHYDGCRLWDYPESDRASALRRLRRLGRRPQFISRESTVEEAQTYLDEVYPDGPFTFHALPFWNHTDTWVLRDIPSRALLRAWVAEHVGQ